MIAASQPASPTKANTPANSHGGAGNGGEGFEVDLRDTLANTIVREVSFAEFRQVLRQYLGHLHGSAS